MKDRDNDVGSTNSSAKRPTVNTSGFAGHVAAVTATQPHCVSMKAAIDSMQTNECGCVPIKLYLWALKFEFHKVFSCHKISFFKTMFTLPLKNVKSILSSIKGCMKIGSRWHLACGTSMDDSCNRDLKIPAAPGPPTPWSLQPCRTPTPPCPGLLSVGFAGQPEGNHCRIYDHKSPTAGKGESVSKVVRKGMGSEASIILGDEGEVEPDPHLLSQVGRHHRVV